MNRPLFVHTDSRILDRILRESEETAMVTTSMVQALQWVTNSEINLSAVFLSPEDSTFSAFRFLEITLLHRPALPVFLFEQTIHANYEMTQKIMKSTYIKGVFSGSESYQTMVATLKENVFGSNSLRKKAPATAHQTGYLALPISDFFTGSEYPYDIFILDPPNSINLFAQKQSAIDPVYLTKASKQVEFLYVKEQDVAQSTYILKHSKAQLMDKEIPIEWKTSEVLVNTRELLKEMKSSGMSDQLIEYTQSMLGDLFKLIAKIESDEGSISRMIDKAKDCDRTVFCASYSILVCKQLRFERTATLEILGLASVLQDISLYSTPLGDLSEKSPGELSPEELKLYLQHPLSSADLVGHHTDVPQVTLQVVRQQHERKDKSGFPNRIGGNQLHPMAEILSLINSYYEVAKKTKDDAVLIQELQKTIFPHYSDNVVQAFKVVLGNILKDKIHEAHRIQAKTGE
ncbi:MAG: hypothetical protein H7333_10180 [Bdellovibrionales bacterium]|nr:hypothetical protein [Oligoflexia bacterium]